MLDVHKITFSILPLDVSVSIGIYVGLIGFKDLDNMFDLYDLQIINVIIRLKFRINKLSQCSQLENGTYSHILR